MKKLLAVVFTLSIVTAGIFAQDAAEAAAPAETTEASAVAETSAPADALADLAVEASKATAEAAISITSDALQQVDFPTGTWVDENWNANWVMDVAKVHLYDAVTGEKIYTFTKDNTENFKFVPSADGISLSFYSKETERAYKITKPLNLEKDLQLYINPDWTDKDYNVTLKFKSVDMPQ